MTLPSSTPPAEAPMSELDKEIEAAKRRTMVGFERQADVDARSVCLGITEEELARWEGQIEKFPSNSRDTILRLVRAVRAAFPLPEEPPANDALQELWTLIAEATRDSARWTRLGTSESAKKLEVSNAAAIAAKERLVAIYERQAEALEMFRDEQSRDKAEVASLESQLERLREESEHLDWCEQSAVISGLRAELERLRADLLKADADLVMAEEREKDLLARLRLSQSEQTIR